MGDNEAQPKQQSFLSKLRQRSAILFTIGLAISVASFVENLHMGKAAIAFVVDELSKIQGWEDTVRAVAAMLHGVLEWWRGVLRDLLSYLPFEIPEWLHDPLSVAGFSLARAWARISDYISDNRKIIGALEDMGYETLEERRGLSFLKVSGFAQGISLTLLSVLRWYLVPMTVAVVTDTLVFATDLNNFSETMVFYAFVLAAFAILAFGANQVHLRYFAKFKNSPAAGYSA